MQNYHLKVKQADHYQTLVRQAREYEEEEERKEMVGKKEVEKALQEKLAFARHCHQDLLGHLLVKTSDMNKNKKKH